MSSYLLQRCNCLYQNNGPQRVLTSDSTAGHPVTCCLQSVPFHVSPAPIPATSLLSGTLQAMGGGETEASTVEQTEPERVRREEAAAKNGTLWFLSLASHNLPYHCRPYAGPPLLGGLQCGLSSIPRKTLCFYFVLF